MVLSIQKSANIKLHHSRKVVIVHHKCGTLLLFVNLRDETRKSNSERKRGKDWRFKPFLLMNEEFCIQYKKINNIFSR